MAMNWIPKLFSGSVGDIVEKVSDLADRFYLSGEEKQRFKPEMEALMQQRDATLQQSLQHSTRPRSASWFRAQGRNYTKKGLPGRGLRRTRFHLLQPTIVPVLAKLAGVDIQSLSLPSEYGLPGIASKWTTPEGRLTLVAMDRLHYLLFTVAPVKPRLEACTGLLEPSGTATPRRRSQRSRPSLSG